MQKPRVGDTVYYYPHPGADQPSPAFIVAAYDSGLVRLTTWVSGPNHWVEKMQVLHKDSPRLKENPGLAVKFGYWEFRDPPEVRNAIEELVYGAKGTEDKASKTNVPKTTAKV